MERANLMSDAHKWQAVIKSGKRGTRYVRVAARNVCLVRASCLWHLVQVQIPSIIDDSSKV